MRIYVESFLGAVHVFFLQATKIVRHNGMSALLATNTIAQGDTREVGLDQITAAGWTIPHAVPSRKWPGEASLEVAHVWLRQGEWHGSYMLNDALVENITPFLTAPGKAQGNPFRLEANVGKSFIGSFVLGMGFVLEQEEAKALIAKDARNKDVLFPYLNGEDLNSRPDQSPSRWVINFHDWPLERAEMYPDCMKIVREKVKPQREQQNDKLGKDIWWRFLRTRPELYAKIVGMKRVLVTARVSAYHFIVLIERNLVFSDRLVVIASQSTSDFTVLSSSLHDLWAHRPGTTTHETRSTYFPQEAFETFPFPTDTQLMNDTGERCDQHRQSIMKKRGEGLTKTYNRFHDPQEKAEDIVRLRVLHREMDEVVAHAYGWDDLRLEHGFHETKQGLRYTISEAARREVLDRLLLLNHQRHEEEVQAGLFGRSERKGGKGRNNSKKHSRNDESKDDLQRVLFSE